MRSERPLDDRDVIATFTVDRKSGRELRQYLGTVATQCSTPISSATVTTPPAGADRPGTTHHVAGETPDRLSPVVIILDDLQHVGSPALLADAFSALLGVPLHQW